MGRTRFSSFMFIVPLAATLGGCAWIDDTSDDNYLYKSTPHLPVTVTLVDTRTDEEVWSQDVPVGSNLKLAFKHNGSADDPYGDSEMVWQWKGRARQAGETSGRVPVPTRDVRRIDVNYRDPVERYVPVPEPIFEPVLAPIDEPTEPETAPEPTQTETAPPSGENTESEPTDPDDGASEGPDAAEDDGGDDEVLDLPPPPPAPTS